MKLCVLSPADSWHFLDLQRAAGIEHQVESVEFETLADLVFDDSVVWPTSLAHDLPHPLESFDCVLARAMPAGSLQQVIFRMDVLLSLERRGLRIINPPRTIEMAVDKYLSLTELRRHGVPIPATAVSQGMSDALRHFQILDGPVVLKPMFGSQGRGLKRIETLEAAKQQFTEALAAGNVIYQQRFIDHGGFDFRLLVIGDEVLCMKRVNHHNWITNIAQGAVGYPHLPTPRESELALTAARAIGAQIAGVDLVYDRATQQPYVLEINSAPSWQAIAQVLQVDIAKRILNYLAKAE